MSKGIERDCTIKCKSSQHGNQINSVITKRDIADTELCSYINWMCTNCAIVSDSMGRNALHVAASCGRTKLLKYLATQTLNINLKDYESGYTPLHRAIFYGKIQSAVALIHLGASIHQLDNNDLSPLDHAMKDRSSNEFTDTALCQLYVWGTNTNYTLGMGHQHAKLLPDLNDAFHKKYMDVSVRQICMSKFHSVVVSREGRVFSCGHGQGGRLGLNTENTVLIPEEIHFNSQTQQNIVEASVGLDHSIFLTDTGNVWTCGLNTHQVLGIKGVKGQLLQPRMVPHLSEIRGVCAGRFHSVAWSVNAVYTWGLHAGQLGHDKSLQVAYSTPKNVTNIIGANNETELMHVAASDGATVVATKKGDVYVFHEYQTRKIASKQLNLARVIVVGGHLNSKLSNDILKDKGGDELKVIVLQTTGNLYLWQESWPQLSQCIYSLNRPLIITDAVLSRTQLFFVTADGEAFRGEFKTRKKPTKSICSNNLGSNAFHEFLNKKECQMIKVFRYPHVHRAVKIHCDLKGRNFAVIQCAPQSLVIEVPEVSLKTIAQDMLNLLNNSNEMDEIHDCTFKVASYIFPVHRYIIAMKSEQLEHLIESNRGNNTPVELTNINPIIFKQILIYIYTGCCDLLICGSCNAEIKTITQTTSKENPIGLLQQAAKRFGLKILYKKLDNYLYTYDGYIQLKNNKKSPNETCKFDRRMCKPLQDIVIKSQNGTEMQAHKCILAARLEYFNNLFAVRWNDSKTSSNKSVITLPIVHTVMETVVDFLYTDEAKDLLNTDDVDYLSNVLVVSDQLFIERLKEICEVALSGLLTLKNCAYMLHFSSTYNALQLKRCIMEFICLNLAAVLEAKILEILDEEILNDLTDFYYNKNKILCSRVITPYSDAPSDKTVKQIAEMYPLNCDEVEKKTPPKLSNNTSGGKRRTPRTRKESVRTKTSISEAYTIEETIINDENDHTDKYKDEWVKILSEKQKHEKMIKNRLRSIENAKNEVLPDCNYTKLSSSFEEPTTSTIYNIPIQMGQKLSQKQRKKLDKTNETEVAIKSPPKTNPWQKIETISPTLSCPKVQEKFLDIITDERKQKENWSKMRARPLIYSQMEDKAINDLERFYNVDQVSDECITIHKVVNKEMIAVPLWVQHNN